MLAIPISTRAEGQQSHGSSESSQAASDAEVLVTPSQKWPTTDDLESMMHYETLQAINASAHSSDSDLLQFSEGEKNSIRLGQNRTSS